VKAHRCFLLLNESQRLCARLRCSTIRRQYLTYIATDEGWLYLAGVKNLFSGEVVGYAMSERMTKSLVMKALFRACATKRPGKGLLHHSDSKYVWAGCSFPGGLTLTAMDRLVGWRRKASWSGLTRTPIDRQPCLSPDLSAARDRLAVRFCLANACDSRRA
jgi:hypothetical protein